MKEKTLTILSIIIIMILVLFFCSFRTIKSGEIGLKTRFGKKLKHH